MNGEELPRARMSFFVAAIWSATAQLFLVFMVLVLMSARHVGQLDLVSQVLCQGVAFIGTLYLLLLMHDPDRSLSDVLALRRTNVSLCVVAVGLGVALLGPISLISKAIENHYPTPDKELEALRLLYTAPTMHEKVALVAAAGVVGPLVEELFFRGGLLRSLRRSHTGALTLFGTSLLFAAAHADPRIFLPAFLGGLAMGYVRIMSGSLWPAILLHASFNTAASLVNVWRGPDAELFTNQQSVVAVFATLALVALFRTLALRSELGSEAREQDLT